VVLIAAAFAFADPQNNCVSNGEFVASQITNGLIIGIIYGFMALGLTLIFSILGVVSFAHGEFYMIGGMLVYYLTAVWLPGLNPLAAVAAACAIAMLIGATFERLMLTPMYHGKVDRPVEYGILATFGLAFTLQYLVQALHGASPVKAQRFIDFPRWEWPAEAAAPVVQTRRGSIEFFDLVTISNPRFVAAVTCIVVLLALLFFLHRTWQGRALRAVAQDREAAAIAGIDPDKMNMLAFALGGMIAALAGALLVQAFSWLPQVGAIPAMRSFVIVVLGGLGSLPGRVHRRHPGRPGRGRGDGLHPERAKGGQLYPRLWHDRADADAAVAAHRAVRPPLCGRRPWPVLTGGRRCGQIQRQIPNAAGVVLILFFALFPLVYSGGNYDYVMHVLITAFFYAILSASWSMLAGYAGQFSFGHMAFMAIGAYTAALFGHYFWITGEPTGLCREMAVLRQLAGGGEPDRRDLDHARPGLPAPGDDRLGRQRVGHAGCRSGSASCWAR
jgi:branched-subunit amino acid ABC-type transport system permease component